MSNQKQFEIGKYYTAKPEFTRSIGESKGQGVTIPKKKMSGKCIHVSPRLVTLQFPFQKGAICESFRHDEVS